MSEKRCLRIGLIGCGAITQLVHSQVIHALSSDESLCVSSLVDPNEDCLSLLGTSFPEAIQCKSLADLQGDSIDLAIIASPQRFHCKQAVTLLENGVHVFCEKPLSSSLEEARIMLAAADVNQRLLAVGLFRRFWPVTQYIQDLISGNDLGKPLQFHWIEGGVFNWPATTPSFFQKASSAGGVFADLGAHVLDLLLLWFGPMVSFEYRDDAMGGLENNALLELLFVNGVAGRMRLSRDTPIPSKVWIEFEKGIVSFNPGAVGEITLQLRHLNFSAKALLLPALTYSQCFSAQTRNVCRAIRREEVLLVPANEALPSMALIDQCYANRLLLEQPWFSPREQSMAQVLVG